MHLEFEPILVATMDWFECHVLKGLLMNITAKLLVSISLVDREDHFHLYTKCIFFICSALISSHMIFIYIHIMSFSSYNGYKLNSHLTCFQRGFIAQLVEHRTDIAEVMGLNPVGASGLYL